MSKALYLLPLSFFPGLYSPKTRSGLQKYFRDWF